MKRYFRTASKAHPVIAAGRMTRAANAARHRILLPLDCESSYPTASSVSIVAVSDPPCFLAARAPNRNGMLNRW